MLRFTAGPYICKVQVADNPLSDYRGQPALGLFHSHRNLSEISPDCPHGERLETMLHELKHFWDHHFPPPPAGSEEAATHYATMTGAILRQLMAQGGPAVLMCLETHGLKGFKASAFGGSLADMGVERMMSCAVCQQRVSPGNVKTAKPRPHPTNSATVIDLAFLCPFCEHVQAWTEFATPLGAPSGVCAMQPEFHSGEDAERFCRENTVETTYHPAT